MKKILINILLVFISINSFSQSNEFGSPLITNYLPTEYNASSQNWCIFQDYTGYLYFGNTSAILKFNGTNWNITTLPNSVTVRSMDMGYDSIMYVGSVDEFGYLAFDSIGRQIYHSLNYKLDTIYNNFGNVWKTLSSKEGIYFFTADKIFFYNYSEINVTKCEMEAFFAFKCYNEIFVLIKNDGLYNLKNNNLTKLPFTEIFTSDYRMYQIIPFKDDKILIASRSNGLFTYDLNYFKENGKYNFSKTVTNPEILQPFETNFSDYIKTKSLYSAAKVNENMFCIGTVEGGAILFDSTGTCIHILNSENGINSNCIYSAFTDNYGDLWLGQQLGISRIDLSYPLTFFNEENNDLQGYVISETKHNNKRYIGTMSGLYYIPENFEDLSKKTLNKVDVPIYEFWDFYSDNEILLSFGSLGILSINDNIKNYIFNESVTTYLKSSKFENIFFIGSSSNGIICIEIVKKNGKVTAKEILKITDVKGIIFKIIEDDEKNIWITSSYKGIYKVAFGESLTDYKVDFYDSSSGLPSNDNNYIENIDNKILALTKKGIFKFAETKNKFISDLSYGKMFSVDSNSIAYIKEIGKKKYLTSGEILRAVIIEIDDDTITFDNMFSQRFPNYYRLKFDSLSNKIFIYTSSGLFIFNLNSYNNNYSNFNTIISSVKINETVEIFSGNYCVNELNSDSLYSKTTLSQTDFLKPILNYNQNSIAFNYSALFFQDAEKTQYSYFLEGYSKEWSELSFKTEANFTNLKEGRYIFKVKAKNIFGIESDIVEYSFRILPPWYRAWWAYFIYVVLAILFIYIIIRLNSSRLIKEKEKLEKIVIERTKEIIEKNEELKQQKDEIQSQNENLEKANFEINNQKNIIEKSHKQITSSITYASRIQKALLPSLEILAESR